MGIEEKITARQARAASRASRKALADPLENPGFAASNPLLPDTDDDEPNQLRKEHQGKVLALEIPQFGQEGGVRQGYIQLYWDGVEIGTRHNFTTPVAPEDFPIPMQLPASATEREGSYKLYYKVMIRTTGNESLPMDVNVDQSAPNAEKPGALVVLPAEVEANGITRAYLDDNGGKVKVTVPSSYSDARIGDVVTVWFGPSIPLAKEVGSVTRNDLSLPIEFDWTESMLVEEGRNSLFYTLSDRKGNVGPNSQYKVVNVELTSPPAGLLPPKVPLAVDGLIDYADVLEGVRVIVEPYENWASRDLVIVTFDGTDHAPQQMPQDGANVLLPYALVHGGDLGEKKSKVTYRIMRGSNPYPEPTGLEFQVDLRTPGPDPEDPPGQVHPGLNVVVVKGSTSPADQLGAADRSGPVNATALIYADPASGEYAQLYWNGVEVPGARYDVQGDETANFQIPFDVPWNIIDTAGNGDIPVHYVVGHALNDNLLNSAAKNVSVEGVPIILPEPAFQHLNLEFPPDEILSCSSLRVEDAALVAEIKVPGGDDRLANKALTFTYQGWADKDGTVAIDGTLHTFPYSPSEQEVEAGFIVNLPYETALRDTRIAWGSIHYTMDVDGVPVDSPRHLVVVEVLRPGDVACEIPASRARR